MGVSPYDLSTKILYYLKVKVLSNKNRSRILISSSSDEYIILKREKRRFDTPQNIKIDNLLHFECRFGLILSNFLGCNKICML